MTSPVSARPRLLGVLLAFLLVALAAPLATPGAGAARKPDALVDVQLLALNDFHGNLKPPSGSSGRITTGVDADGKAVNVDAGGVEYLATHVKRLREENANTAVVSAGDLIGASPLLSALFHDEPTVEAMNRLGLDFNAVGNHEFDEGATELRRMQEGGCHPDDGCQDGDGFGGAEFRFLAANVVDAANGKPLFPAYKIRSFGGARIAFIGMTLEGTPSIVTPSGIQGLRFLDEAETVNRLVPEIRDKGVEAIVVLVHEGGVQSGRYNDCDGVSGPIVDIVERFDDAVDVVVSGHTHQAYRCAIAGKLVTSAASFGRLVTDIDLQVDRRRDEIVSAAADNVIVTRDVSADADQTALIERYGELAAPLENRVIGSISSDITRDTNPAGESALGDVIADAQLAATRDPSLGGAVAAFMNPGGIRADLTFAQSGEEGDGNVTYGEAFTVQPFGNNLVTMTLSGTQIDTLLEQQWAGQTRPRILQVSDGFAYTWDALAPIGERVDASSITIGGVSVDPNAGYRVTVNSFLADGGDNFSVLTQGTDRLGGVVDVDALDAYFGANSPLQPGPQNRITRVN